MKLYAPWTPEQIAALNQYQTSGAMHPFTCGMDTCRGVLMARDEGWICHCGYTQAWAWSFMVEIGSRSGHDAR